MSVEEEVGYVKRLELVAIAERKLDMRNLFAKVLTGMIGLFMTLFVVLLMWTLALMLPSQANKQAELLMKTCDELTYMLNKVVASENFSDEARRLINESTAYDRAGLKNFISKLGVDPLSQGSGTSDTISINKVRQGNSKYAEPVTVAA